MNEMEKKKHYRHRLSDEVADYIKDYAVINELPYHSSSEALERIIREHMENDKDNFRLDYIVKSVTSEVTKSVQISLQESITKEINKVRLGTNNADRNTQIIIEILQGFMQNQNIEHIITTNNNKPSFLIEAENIIQEKITNQKQKKDSKN